MHNTTFRNNSAKFGGGINAEDQCHVQLTNCSFLMNKAMDWDYSTGGAISVGSQTEIIVEKCWFEYNSAQHLGGAIYGYSDVTIKIIDSDFARNRASWTAGAILISDNVTLEVEDTTFTSNSADNGGAIYSQTNSNLRFVNCTFINNKAQE